LAKKESFSKQNNLMMMTVVQ